MNSKIVLYESEIAQFPDVHVWLIDKLSLPEWYGRNLDALWDCITGYINLPVTICWISDSTIEGNKYSGVIELFQEAAEEMDGLQFEYSKI